MPYAHSLNPDETFGVSSGSKLYTTFLNLAKHDEKMSKNQFTGTATQPQRNRKLCQFNKNQYNKYIEKSTETEPEPKRIV